MKTELTEWQTKKFLALFDLFDTDADGIIDESDLEGARERIQLDTGWPESSRVINHVTARWNVFLKVLFVDSPLLKAQKWVDFLGRLLNQDREARATNAGFRGVLEEFAQLLFLLLDRDRNSKIDYQEFLIFYYALGLKDQAAEESFEKFDTDQDGFVSKTEMEDMVLEYFHGAQPGSHGDWLFGLVPKSENDSEL